MVEEHRAGRGGGEGRSRAATKGGRARTRPSRALLEERGELRQRPPWWGRLEARITISLVAIGILCVGASGYLVALSVGYYDQLSAQQVAVEREAIELAEPYYAELAAAQRAAFEAQTALLPHELEGVLDEPRADRAEVEAFLDAWLVEHDSALEVVVEPDPGDLEIVVSREGSGGSGRGGMGGAPRAGTVPIRRALGHGEGEGVGGSVQVTWAADPAMLLRHQRLGELARSVGTVEISGSGGETETVERNDIQRAMVMAIALASGLVLFVAVLAGLIIARRTTRKVSDLSTVMRQVASGNLSVRAPRLGADELGLLAAAFNLMLDELEDTRQRIAYLQRVGAWQEMARRIAHEIKNPLTPIQLAVQQLREKDPGKDPRFSAMLRDAVEIVEDEVESLRRMVTSFSEFAKVPEVSVEAVTVARILGEFERAYGQFGEAQVEVAPAPKLALLGDRQLLKQVLVNLVENAVLSAREAGAEPVRVRVCAELNLEVGLGGAGMSASSSGEGAAPGPGVVELRVEDNGPGVELARRELVFEPYETTREHGTGLGLAIVKKIVLDHGGEVFVDESPELGGARFVLRIPRA
ncbi:periplasmic sensor signal transduction histidine kinase [Plesiocystis pacifica SIR-1]|uniref:histidine kinase n=1 Tax=Plesiocystis pacifica SIR-1 TaxID=391625 RepID=A6GA64_9BACT|nr:ATP-binding protein [Plesiocystis pacifica]EDM77277.1 periplasmic sensor signal transduction histidine kinase [Plesiocystis pacifica SIR-1]